MNPHRTIVCRLYLLAALASLICLRASVAVASVPVDWAERLALATNVSYEGYADSSFAKHAQDSAIAMASAILADIQVQYAADSLARAEVFSALGDYSFRKGEFSDAASYWLRASELRFPPTADVSLRPCLLVIAGHREALDSTLATEFEARYTHLLQQCPSDSLVQLWTIAHLCENMWLMGEARSLHERVVAISDSHPGANSRWTIRSLVTLGEMTSKRVGIPHTTNPSALQDSAVWLAEKALELARTQFGPTDTMFAYVADRLGDYYSRLGRRAAAYALWDSAWTANRIHLAPEHIELQGNLDRMASVYRSQGRFVEAEMLAKQALDLRMRTRGEGHPEVASMYTNLGRIYHTTGKYRQAEECYREALRIRELAIEQSVPLIAESYRQLGDLCYDDGRYALADGHYRHAIAMMRDALGGEHSWVAACLRDMAHMYITWGRPEEALNTLNDALQIQTQFLRGQHPAVAATLEEIARVELLLGNVTAAASAIDHALDVDRVAVATGSLPQSSLLTTKARVLLSAGSPALAESVLRQSLGNRGEQEFISDPQLVDDLTLLASIQSEQGNLGDARGTYDRILAIDSLYNGLNVIAMADARDRYACFLLDCGESTSALEIAMAALRQRLSFLDEGGQVLSEYHALQFERAMHRSRDIMATAYFASDSHPVEATINVCDLLIASKGAISNRIFERARDARHSNSYVVVTLRDSLQFVRHRLAMLYLRGPGDLPPAAYGNSLDSLRVMKTGLDERLAIKLGHEQDHGADLVATMERARQGLPVQSTLLEYIKYRSTKDNSGDRYALLVLPDTGKVSLMDLGESAPIEALMRDYQALMSVPTDQGAPPTEADQWSYAQVAHALYSRIWGPILTLLRPNTTVFVAPDAELYLLSFAGLVNDEGQYLIEVQPIHYLSCGRSLTESRDASPSGSALVFCDPDFDADVDSRTHAIASELLSSNSHEEASDFVTVRSSCEHFAERKFSRLPGTREEGNAVRVRLSEHGIGPIDVLAGAAASEENFKRRAENSRVLHLATHGFFLDQKCAIAVDQHREASRTALIGENPLLLSGLCLAGANRHDENSAQFEDGLLTAEEVASLQLDGTEWVVLSACDTRLGEARQGEGLFGLQRAFQMAGANTVISALWPVSDRATAAFMRSLYSITNEPLYVAMRQSQLDAIRDLRKRGQPDHPYNWAGFVAVGGWNPLN